MPQVEFDLRGSGKLRSERRTFVRLTQRDQRKEGEEGTPDDYTDIVKCVADFLPQNENPDRYTSL